MHHSKKLRFLSAFPLILIVLLVLSFVFPFGSSFVFPPGRYHLTAEKSSEAVRDIFRPFNNILSLSSQLETIQSSRTKKNEEGVTQKAPCFTLAVFPLRKQVKFPTESIQLNLFEERYRALAKYVISQNKENNQQGFGALYCSHKAQIAPNGVLPITPIITRGDVGVLCMVQESEIVLTPQKEEKEKVRLKGLAVGRFRVERILHNGFGGGEEMETNSCTDDESLPFIMVEASLLEDVIPTSGSRQDCFCGEMEEKILENVNAEEFLMPTDFFSKGSYSCSFNSNSNQLRQLWSFCLASRLIPNASMTDMLKLLECTSTAQRLEYVYDSFSGQPLRDLILRFSNSSNKNKR